MPDPEKTPQKKSGDFLGLRHHWFNALWVRIALVVLCIGWGAFEFWSGETVWAILFGGIGLYAAFVFFISDRDFYESAGQHDDSPDEHDNN